MPLRKKKALVPLRKKKALGPASAAPLVPLAPLLVELVSFTPPIGMALYRAEKTRKPFDAEPRMITFVQAHTWFEARALGMARLHCGPGEIAVRLADEIDSP